MKQAHENTILVPEEPMEEVSQSEEPMEEVSQSESASTLLVQLFGAASDGKCGVCPYSYR